jgi:hypothetical protein
MIKKEFWNDEKVGRLLSRCSRLTFVGIWNLCDDIGICRASASFVRSQLYPYDKELSDSDIEKEINEMLSSKMISLAHYKGEKYLKVKHFSRHQVINRPSRSYTIAGLEKEQIDELFSELRDQQDASESLPSVEEVVSAEIAKIFAPDPIPEEVDEDSASENRDSEITIEPVEDFSNIETVGIEEYLSITEDSSGDKKAKQGRPSFRLPSSDTG